MSNIEAVAVVEMVGSKGGEDEGVIVGSDDTTGEGSDFGCVDVVGAIGVTGGAGVIGFTTTGGRREGTIFPVTRRAMGRVGGGGGTGRRGKPEVMFLFLNSVLFSFFQPGVGAGAEMNTGA